MKQTSHTLFLLSGSIMLCMTSNATPATPWLRPDDGRTALIAVCATAATWGTLELVRSCFPRTTALQKEVSILQKELVTVKNAVKKISDNMLSDETNLVLHQLCSQYGLVDEQGNFKRTKGGTAEDFLQVQNTIKLITQCPQTIACLSSGAKQLETRIAELEKNNKK